MSEQPNELQGTGAAILAMRQEFDEAFARTESERDENLVQLLRFRIGQRNYAVSVDSLSEVHELHAVARVPGSHPGLEGICGVHGQIVAVHSLAQLVGAERAGGAARWLLITRQDRHLGFSVHGIEGYQAVPRTEFVEAPAEQRTKRAITFALQEQQTTRLIVDFNVLISDLRSSFGVGTGGAR